MQLLRVSVSILAALSVFLMILLNFLDASKKNAPVITCKSDDVIVVPSGVSDEDLLKYVTATDKEDGNITDKIIVERQTYFLEKGLSTVVFSVCDSDNNTAKISRNILFEDYNSPEIQLHNDLIIPIKSSFDFKNSVTVDDKFDGNISNRVKIISPSFNNIVAGEYDINFKVTNSFSDTCDITVKAIVTDEDYSAAEIKLSKYIIYSKKGENIDFSEFLIGVTDHINAGYKLSNVTIDSSEYNPNSEGVYNIYYSIKKGNSTVTKTRLIIVKGE